jgi:putative membrane protein
VIQALPYCGSAPTPSEIFLRVNLDPVLIGALLILCAGHVLLLQRQGPIQSRRWSPYAIGGWLIAATALLSPLCALSVALFSARVTQHMLLILVAAPLVALGLPRLSMASRGWSLWVNALAFFLALWFWHMPIPYEATFSSALLYWTMHLTLFGSGVLLWRALLYHPAGQTAQALAAGCITFIHMGLLGAVLAFAERPLFVSHLLTTQVWGLTPLQDQQLGGAIMWVPGMVLFVWTAMRSIVRLWAAIERARPA